MYDIMLTYYPVCYVSNLHLANRTLILLIGQEPGLFTFMSCFYPVLCCLDGSPVMNSVAYILCLRKLLPLSVLPGKGKIPGCQLKSHNIHNKLLKSLVSPDISYSDHFKAEKCFLFDLVCLLSDLDFLIISQATRILPVEKVIREDNQTS